MSGVRRRDSGVTRDKGKFYAHCIQGPKFENPLKTTCLGLLFFNNAEKYKDNICQISAVHNIPESYGSVKQRTVRLALELEKKGVTYKDVIAICSDHTMDNIIPIISAMYIGAKVANIDRTLNTRQINQMLCLISPTVIFVEEATYQLIKDTIKESNMKTEIVILGALKPYRDEITYSPSKVDVHETAFLFFSGESSGIPKAACHSHFSLMRMVQTLWNADLYSKNVLHFTTYCWITFILINICCFLNGATRIFCRDVIRGDVVKEYIEDYQVTSIFMAPINSVCLTEVQSDKNFKFLKLIVLTGSTVSRRMLKQLNDMYPNVNIIFSYGLTEVGLVTTFNPTTDKELIKSKIGSCGKIVAEAKIKIVNVESEESLTHDKTGEIRIKSPGLMKGYHCLDCSEFFDSEGFLKTGDLGYFDKDECFYVLSKIKDTFKYKGHLIVPSKIEEVILQHPAVKEAAVFALTPQEDEELPAACIVLLSKNLDVVEADIKKFVSKKVLDEEKLRGGIKFVGSIPKSPMGGCLRRELKSLFLESKKESFTNDLFTEHF